MTPTLIIVTLLNIVPADTVDYLYENEGSELRNFPSEVFSSENHAWFKYRGHEEYRMTDLGTDGTVEIMEQWIMGPGRSVREYRKDINVNGFYENQTYFDEAGHVTEEYIDTDWDQAYDYISHHYWGIDNAFAEVDDNGDGEIDFLLVTPVWQPLFLETARFQENECFPGSSRICTPVDEDLAFVFGGGRQFVGELEDAGECVELRTSEGFLVYENCRGRVTVFSYSDNLGLVLREARVYNQGVLTEIWSYQDRCKRPWASCTYEVEAF